MLTITVAQDGSGDFASVSEAVLAVPYACAAEIRIGPGVYREKLVCEKQDITLIGAGMESTRIVWGDGGKLPSKTMPAPGQRWGRPWRLMWTALTPSLRMCGC